MGAPKSGKPLEPSLRQSMLRWWAAARATRATAPEARRRSWMPARRHLERSPVLVLPKVAPAPPPPPSRGMWLSRWLVPVSRLVAGGYYRVAVVGSPIPATGPVLVVGNHPNMLFDPLLLTAAAGRPLRFVAKSPLFDAIGLGQLMHAIGALPVVRRSDPGAGNCGDVGLGPIVAALVAGDAVLIFPEGTSPASGELLPFKSGAARLVLAAARYGVAVTVVPMGTVYEERTRPGSRVTISVGTPVRCHDLPARPDDRVSTGDLTRRMDTSVRNALASSHAAHHAIPRASWRTSPQRILSAPLRWALLNLPMRIALQLSRRSPHGNEEQATHHLVIGLMLLLVTWAIVLSVAATWGGIGAAAAALIGFPMGILVSGLAAGPWAVGAAPGPVREQP